ncbi:MAG: tRNA 2-selenouridine(34) synthase MnmH [Cyclobacteriaceae bacterium]
MSREIDWTSFLSLRKELPVVDVRSPLEYDEGHIHNAHNIPLLNNEERSAVGIDYKNNGRRSAIRTGFKLVGPRLNEIVDRAEELAQGQDLLVHCWRGGMRSANFAQFVGMAGVKSHVLAGGYKTYRTQALHSFATSYQFILLSGSTGSGKTDVLNQLQQEGEQVIDLEGLANHKGSAFGALNMPPQPTTEQFQNELFENLLRLDPSKPIWLEDESIAIGKIFLPSDFWNQMRESPVIMLEVKKDVRVQRLVNDYGSSDKEQFLTAMSKITKKLGGQNFIEGKKRLERDDMAGVMEILLTYYDKAYGNSMEKRKPKKLGSVVWDGKDLKKIAKQLVATI